MASGIKVAERVKPVVEAMKVNKTQDDASQRLRVVTFTIQNDLIDVDKEIKECDLCECDALDKFLGLLQEKDCFYFLYDCHYENNEGIPKEELIFGSWVPDTCEIKSRMKYASSKSSIKNLLKGLKHDLQMNDRSECSNRDDFATRICKGAAGIEGKPLKCKQHAKEHPHHH